MTDTRDELVTEVIDIYAEPENFPREDASEHAEKILRLIDEAVAHRDAEIREAAMTLGVMRQVSNAIALTPFTVLNPRTTAQVAVEAMLKAIGLAEKGAER